MATKTSRRAPTADAATAADKTIGTAADATISTASTADTDITDAPVSVPARRITKAAQLRAMLDAPGGASLTALMAATGWQAHTVRAALSGLRKGGNDLAREKRDGDTIYRIVGAGAQEASNKSEPAWSQPTEPGGATADTEVPS